MSTMMKVVRKINIFLRGLVKVVSVWGKGGGEELRSGGRIFDGKRKKLQMRTQKLPLLRQSLRPPFASGSLPFDLLEKKRILMKEK
jgi:hypothetical protein